MPPIGPVLDFLRRGGFVASQLGVLGWHALLGACVVSGVTIYLATATTSVVSMAVGVGSAWLAALAADRVHAKRVGLASRDAR